MIYLTEKKKVCIDFLLEILASYYKRNMLFGWNLNSLPLFSIDIDSCNGKTNSQWNSSDKLERQHEKKKFQK